MLARNFLVLERESSKLTDPETDAAEIRGGEEFLNHVIAERVVKPPHLTHVKLLVEITENAERWRLRQRFENRKSG